MRALWLAVLLLAGCAAPPGDGFDYESCGVRPKHVLTLEMRGNIPLVRGSVKGVPALFVLDTGAVSVALTEQARIRFGLASDTSVTTISSGVGGQHRAYPGKLENFRIGDIEVPDHRVSILPATAGISQSGIDGLFGVSVLSIFEVEVDLAGRQVTLHAGRLCPDTVAPAWAPQARVLDASRSERGRFLVPMTLEGQMVTALIDTGAARTVVSRDVALRVGASAQALAAGQQVTLSGTGPQTVSASVYRFRDVGIAGQRFPDLPLLVADRADPSIDVILGADYLGNRRIWLSYARRRVFISP